MLENNYENSNAWKYAQSQWCNPILKNYRQSMAIRETLSYLNNNVLANGVKINYHGKILEFKCFSEEDLNFTCKFKDYQSTSYPLGEYDHESKTIYLNSSLKNDGPTAFSTIYHEYVHAIQNVLVEHIKDFEIDSPEYEYLSLIESEVKHRKLSLSAFGIAVQTDIYVSPSIGTDVADPDLILALYNLQASERIAKSTESNAFNYITQIEKLQNLNFINNPTAASLAQEKAVNFIKDFYEQQNLRYSDICNLIDKSKLNILRNQSPTLGDDIEAVLTYDLIVVLKIQASIETPKDVLRNEYSIVMNIQNKEFALNNFYKDESKFFTLPNSGNRVDNYVFTNDYYGQPETLETLLEMDKETQIRNPLLIISTICFASEQDIPLVVKAIKDIDALKAWYYSEDNSLSTETMKIVSLALDKGKTIKEFSPEARENNRFSPDKVSQNKSNIKTLDFAPKFFNEILYTGKDYPSSWKPEKNKPKPSKDVIDKDL